MDLVESLEQVAVYPSGSKGPLPLEDMNTTHLRNARRRLSGRAWDLAEAWAVANDQPVPTQAQRWLDSMPLVRRMDALLACRDVGLGLSHAATDGSRQQAVVLRDWMVEHARDVWVAFCPAPAVHVDPEAWVRSWRGFRDLDRMASEPDTVARVADDLAACGAEGVEVFVERLRALAA